MLTRRQLEDAGLAGAAITRWLDSNRLHRVYPGVYCLGHRRLGTQGRLAAALFYAGKGAALRGQTGAWWMRIIGAPPSEIHVNAPADRRSLPGVCIHRPRSLARGSFTTACLLPHPPDAPRHRRRPSDEPTPPRPRRKPSTSSSSRWMRSPPSRPRKAGQREVTRRARVSSPGAGTHKERAGGEVPPTLRAPLPYPTRRKRRGSGPARRRGVVRPKAGRRAGRLRRHRTRARLEADHQRGPRPTRRRLRRAGVTPGAR